MCLYSKLIKNPKYKANKKNGGVIPAVNDIRVTMVPIGCGECIECRKQKARQWQVRLLEDVKDNRNGKFITLTLSNESIIKLDRDIEKVKGYDRDNAIATLAVRRFLERWRKEYKKSVRHWLITEIGHEGTENIHLHGIIWTDNRIEDIERHWRYGWIYPRTKEEAKNNYVTARTVNYIIKYVTKTDEKNKGYKSVILTSAGIGANYINKTDIQRKKYKEGKTEETYRTETGHKINMPIYWKNKIYTDEEREKLWIEKLNKETRYVDGIKIRIDKNEIEYEAAIKLARIKNKELGYGGEEISQEEYEYRKERRNIKIETRIKKAEEKEATGRRGN